jgi:hypothetical protein
MNNIQIESRGFLSLTTGVGLDSSKGRGRKCIDGVRLTVLLAGFAVLISVGWPEARAQKNGTSPQNITLDRRGQLGYLVVSPQGPKDGGDFGPHTLGTKTSGLQEAFDRAKETTQNLFIVGGNLTSGKNQGVVYFLDETLRIPWMQDFQLGGGEYVIQYRPQKGDAIVIDSQMSCHYKFGIISSSSNGAVLRIQPAAIGPDQFQVFTTTFIHINALVGGGGAWKGGKPFANDLNRQHVWQGTGLWLDASKGSVNDNRITVMEIVGCRTALLLTGRCSNNWIDAPFLHLSQTHLQLGTLSDHAQVSGNRIRATMDSQGIPGAVGARIFGIENLLELSAAENSPGHDVVFEASSKGNLVMAGRLPNGITNDAVQPTNRIIAARAGGFAVTTPPVPQSGHAMTNRLSTSVEIMIVQPGLVSAWTLGDVEGTLQQFDVALQVGQSIRLAPGESIQFDYTTEPHWRWRAVPW